MGALYDPIRRREVPATPEEAVRQAVLRYVTETLGVPPRLIGVEFSLASLVPGDFRRVDVVVWRPGPGQLSPWLLVECKAPGVRLDDDVALQTGHYLARVPCEFVMVTNGADTRYLAKAGEGYSLADSLPFYPGREPAA